MSTDIVEIFDGLELVSSSELRNSVLVANYKLTRDMPMGEYSKMLTRLRAHWMKSGYRTVHINVNRKSEPRETLSEKQTLVRSMRTPSSFGELTIEYPNVVVYKTMRSPTGFATKDVVKKCVKELINDCELYGYTLNSLTTDYDKFISLTFSNSTNFDDVPKEHLTIIADELEKFGLSDITIKVRL